MLAAALEFSEKELVVSMRLAAPRDNGSVDIAIDTILKLAQPPIPVVKLEGRRTVRQAMPSGELEVAFKQANRELNELFERLIPEAQHMRFKKGWRP